MTIQRHLLHALLFLVVITTLGAGIAQYESLRRTLTQNALHQLSWVADIQKSRLQSALQQRHSRLALVMSRTQMRMSLAKYIADGDMAAQQKMNRIIADAQNAIPDFRQALLLDLQGRVVASTDASQLGKNWTSHSAFQAGQSRQRVDLLSLNEQGKVLSWLAGPLMLNQQVIGVLLIESSVDDLIAALRAEDEQALSGETLIARRTPKGDAQFITPIRFDPQAALKRQVSKQNEHVPITQALRKREISIPEAISYNGDKVLAVTRYLPEVDWGIAVLVEHRVAYASLHQLRSHALFIALIAIAVASLLAVKIARSLSRPLVELAIQAERYRHGEQDQATQKNESRYAEINSLQKTFAAMAQGLTQRNRNLAISLQAVEEVSQARQDALTELKQTQAQLLRNERLAALGDAVPGLVHEVNNPLGLAVTMSSTLSDSLKQGAAQLADETMTQGGLDTMMSKCLQASEIIERNLRAASELMKSYQTVSIDQANNQSRDFDVVAYINDVLTNLRPHIKRAPHEIKVHGPEHLNLHSKPGALSQILTNLIMNSYLHGFEEQQSGQIDIRLNDNGDQIEINYQDNGLGIATEDLARVFDKYYTTRPDSGGHGLGLHVVKQLVEQELHGSISLQSAYGEGVHFLIRLPKQRNETKPT